MGAISRWLIISATCLSMATAEAAGTNAITDLQGLIDSQLAQGLSTVTIEPGRYYVAPSNRKHLRFANLSNVTIIANDVEMVCTETTMAIEIVNCVNLTIQGMTIDYDPLPFTQGRIVSLSNDDTVHEIELFDGYPGSEHVYDFKYEIFNSDTRTLRYGSYHDFTHRKLDDRHIEITRGGTYQGEQVGDIIVIGNSDAPGGQIPHAIYTTGSDGVVLKDIILYASNCFGFFETNCTGTHYLRCKVDRRPAATDLKPREDPRIRSLNADANHSKYAVVGPTLEECTARFMGDDAININGNYHIITACTGSILRVLAKNTMNIQSGDSLELWSYTGERIPDAVAVSVSAPVGDATVEELAFLAGLDIHPDYQAGNVGQAHLIEIDRAVDLPMGSLIASSNRMGNGFRVIGCDFGFNRSRGILIKASNGIVQSNRLEGCWGEAIKVAPEYWWLESGNASNVEISDNTILNCLSDGIAIYATSGQGGYAPAGAHTNIVIENNAITNTSGLHIWVTSTKGLVLSGNQFDEDKFELVKCADVYGAPERAGILAADYNADYSASAPLTTGWRYLWNAPVGWQAGVSSGDLASGAIGNPDNYVELLDAGSMWTPDGDTSGVNNFPDNYLKLTANGGHPGRHADGSNLQDRYAIAAFTVSSNGIYAIENSFLTKPSSSGDGVEVLVFADGISSSVIQRVAGPVSTTNFNGQIGYLEAGQSIYVAFGANAYDASDYFTMDYKIFQYPATFDAIVMARNPGYVAWKNLHKLMQGADGNDDGDVLSNFEEFACGGDPTNSSHTGHAPGFQDHASGFDFVYVQRRNSSVGYTPEVTEDLAAGNWSPIDTAESSTNYLDSDFDEVKTPIEYTGKTNEFIRLMLEQL